MRTLSLVLSILLSAFIVLGCGKETSTEKVTESTKAESSADSVVDTDSKPVMDTDSKSVMDTASKQEKELANTASAIAESSVQKAQELIDQAMQYINDGRLDLAEGAITQLESMEDSLPDSIKSQIENLKNLLAAKQSTEDATKTAESVQGLLPGQTK